VSVPDEPLCQSGCGPVETELFCIARKNLYSIGAKGYEAHKRIEQRRAGYYAAMSDRRVSPEMLELRRLLWREARADAAAWVAAFEEAMEMYFFLEDNGYGVMFADFVGRRRGRERSESLSTGLVEPETDEQTAASLELLRFLSRDRMFTSPVSMEGVLAVRSRSTSILTERGSTSQVHSSPGPTKSRG